MSRKRRLMVPVVTLLALSIGISGYYIDNQRILREEAEKQQSQNQTELNKDELQNAQKVDQLSSNEDNSTDETTSDKAIDSNSAIQYVVEVEAEVEDNSKVLVKAKIEASDPGSCVFSLKQGGFGPVQEVKTTGGTCDAEFDIPGSGKWDVNVIYTSSDNKISGNGSIEIEL